MGDSTKKNANKDEISADEFKGWTSAGLVILLGRYAAGQLRSPIGLGNAERAAAELNTRLPPRTA